MCSFDRHEAAVSGIGSHCIAAHAALCRHQPSFPSILRRFSRVMAREEWRMNAKVSIASQRTRDEEYARPALARCRESWKGKSGRHPEW